MQPVLGLVVQCVYPFSLLFLLLHLWILKNKVGLNIILVSNLSRNQTPLLCLDIFWQRPWPIYTWTFLLCLSTLKVLFFLFWNTSSRSGYSTESNTRRRPTRQHIVYFLFYCSISCHSIQSEYLICCIILLSKTCLYFGNIFSQSSIQLYSFLFLNFFIQIRRSAFANNT